MSVVDLQVRDVTVRFGGLVAVNSVSFEVARGETFGVIGPNGAGKSTLLNAISGLVRMSGGTVHVVGEPVGGLRPDQRTRLGAGRTFQAAEVFNDFRVIDYVSLGRLRHQRASLLATSDRLLLAEVLAQARADGVSIVVVDHDVHFVSDSCDRLLVMDAGTEIATGEPADGLARPAVQAAYVGLEVDPAD